MILIFKTSIFLIPKTASRPKTPPLIFPASYAVFPMTIANKINRIIIFLRTGFFISFLIISESPFLEIIPSLADISCKTIVAITERTNVQRRE